MFWETFYSLCQNNDEKPLNVVKKLSVAHGSITNWKKVTVPNGKTLQKIADYFNVSVDYLLTGQKETPTAESDERKKELIELFSLLDDAGQDALIAIAQQMRKQDK